MSATTERPLDELLAASRERKALPPPRLRRELRRGNNVSQQAVAAHVGVSRAAIAAYESGTRSPSGEHLTRYAALLRLFAEELGA